MGGAAYRSLDLGSTLSGGVVECGTDRVLWLPYVEVGSVETTTQRFLAIILSQHYPAAVYVEPTTAWAWSYSFLFGLATNRQFSGSITAMWSWNCYQVH